MTKSDGKPCKKCGTSEWNKGYNCVKCARDRARSYYWDNKSKIAEYGRHYRRDNQDTIKERSRRYRQNSAAAVNQYNRLYRQSHPEEMKAITRRSRQANPATCIAMRHRHRARKTAAGGSFTAAEWKSLINHFGGKCLCCGRDDVKLTADHVIPVAKGGTSNIDNIQPLCVSCNCRKQDKTIDYRPGSGLGRWIQRKLFG